MASIDILSSLNKSGSGINLKDLTSSLVDAATSAPKAAAQAKIDSADLAISNLGTLRSQLSTMASTLSAIAASDTLAVSSTSSSVSAQVTDRGLVQTADTSIDVVQLAKAQVLEFGGFTAADQTLTAGTITVDFGAWYEDSAGADAFALKPNSTSFTITVTDGMTLKQLASSIASISGLDAAVIDKGDGTFSLGVAGQTGAGNAVRFTVAETVSGSGLAVFDTTATNADVQVQAAQNAALTVNGVLVQRETNTVDDVIDGVTLTLNNTGSSTITTEYSAAQAKANITALLTQINTTKSMLADLGQRATADAKAGPLAGDATVRQMSQQLDALLRTAISGYGSGSKQLTDFGIRTADDGSLYLDEPAFTKAFAAAPSDFDALFSDRLEGNGIRFSGVMPPTLFPGSYSFRRDAATGAATFDGVALAGLDTGDGTWTYYATAGAASGMILSVDADVTSSTVSVGSSFLTQLDALLTEATKSDGFLDTATERYNTQSEDAQAAIDKVTSHAEALQGLYTKRFAAMEEAVTRFHSTSSYLDSLVAQWNKKE